jgi:hypothetical protein
MADDIFSDADFFAAAIYAFADAELSMLSFHAFADIFATLSQLRFRRFRYCLSPPFSARLMAADFTILAFFS